MTSPSLPIKPLPHHLEQLPRFRPQRERFLGLPTVLVITVSFTLGGSCSGAAGLARAREAGGEVPVGGNRMDYGIGVIKVRRRSFHRVPSGATRGEQTGCSLLWCEAVQSWESSSGSELSFASVTVVTPPRGV